VKAELTAEGIPVRQLACLLKAEKPEANAREATSGLSEEERMSVRDSLLYKGLIRILFYC
jgi:hypothetical protein